MFSILPTDISERVDVVEEPADVLSEVRDDVRVGIEDVLPVVVDVADTVVLLVLQAEGSTLIEAVPWLTNPDLLRP